MEVYVNGKAVSCKDGATLQEILIRQNFSMDRIAAEVNGEIIPKSGYGAYQLHENDHLEVVSFVGGG